MSTGTDEAASDYVDRNRTTWTRLAINFVASGEREWATANPVWGIFLVPEAEVGMFPDDVAGMDTIELGCGTAYVSAWLAQRGAKPKGIDITPAQLETARLLQDRHDFHFPLIEGNAEATPFQDELPIWSSVNMAPVSGATHTSGFRKPIASYGGRISAIPAWSPVDYRLLSR